MPVARPGATTMATPHGDSAASPRAKLPALKKLLLVNWGAGWPTVRLKDRETFPTLAVTTSYPPQRLAEADYIVPTLKLEEVRKKVPQLKGILQ